ncbi:hypothetical protein MACK_003891 [Theileria orientalis]|uniref:Uncharacterized protein n=1 Tax=Theileria orientalis TaxID=68886 RepID=A0A976SJ32_THEOR|nr:hypothetical protein MACK_003891 [Theileria orientalis]
MSWFKIPWHVNGSSPRKVLKLMAMPLCTSLLNTCISLNVLIYVLVNFTKFTYPSFVLSYISGVSSSISFILTVLSVIYGNYIFLMSSMLLQIILTSSLFGILINFWRITDLSENIDIMVFHIIRYIITLVFLALLFLEYRFLLVSIALGRAMYKKGVSWDLDDVEAVQDQFKAFRVEMN